MPCGARGRDAAVRHRRCARRVAPRGAATRRRRGLQSPLRAGRDTASSREDLIGGRIRADRSEMIALLVLGFVLFWATLMRALLVKAALLPAPCPGCGLRLERSALGEPVCRCHGF